MTIEKKILIKSEYGSEIPRPCDGFIIVGSIHTAQIDSSGDPYGGILVGDSIHDHEMRAYTKSEMLAVLRYTEDDLRQELARRTREVEG